MKRLSLLELIVPFLEAREDVLACWEGGSAAFGAVDELSDIDLQAVVSDDRVGAVSDALECFLASQIGIDATYHVPQPSWHGHTQAFYLFKDTSPFHMLDFVLIKESVREPRFLEPERHGKARMLFDKGGFVDISNLDWNAHNATLQLRKKIVVDSFRVMHWLVDKEIERKRSVDAIHFHINLVMPKLIELLRIQHCPERHDFGFRYLARDLPPQIYAQVEPLFYVVDLSDLSQKKARAVELFGLAERALGFAPG